MEMERRQKKGYMRKKTGGTGILQCLSYLTPGEFMFGQDHTIVVLMSILMLD